jgi:hypothetical protein
MRSPKQREIQAFGDKATGFVQTMYFDMQFNYIRGSVEQTIIFPDPSANWESESCKLIPYVRYEYTRVSKKNPETNRSALARINRAREKVKDFASLAKTNGSVLRIIKETVVIKLQPNIKAKWNVELSYLEESLGSLSSDPIASKRKTREIPSFLKEKAKAASKKNESKSKMRRVK